MKGDPYYITVRYPGECSICHRKIYPGERALYFPRKRGLQCEVDEKCHEANKETMSAIHDEDFFPNRSL